jgi:hypothetical protein
MQHMQRDRVIVVFDLLREGIGQSREPAHRHAHTQIVPLDEAGRYVPRIGPSFDGVLMSANEFCWAI